MSSSQREEEGKWRLEPYKIDDVDALKALQESLFPVRYDEKYFQSLSSPNAVCTIASCDSAPPAGGVPPQKARPVIGVAAIRVASKLTEGPRARRNNGKNVPKGAPGKKPSGGGSSGGGGWISWLIGGSEEGSAPAAGDGAGASASESNAAAGAGSVADTVAWGKALEEGRSLYLMSLGVDVPFRRRGVGMALLEEIILAAGEKRAAGALASPDPSVPAPTSGGEGDPCPFDWLLLHVLASNVAAISFYESCGFTNDGVNREYYFFQGNRHDAVCMSLPITADMFQRRAKAAALAAVDPAPNPAPNPESSSLPVSDPAPVPAQAENECPRDASPRVPAGGADTPESDGPRDSAAVAVAVADAPSTVPAPNRPSQLPPVAGGGDTPVRAGGCGNCACSSESAKTSSSGGQNKAGEIDMSRPPVGFPTSGSWFSMIPVLGACMSPAAVGGADNDDADAAPEK